MSSTVEQGEGRGEEEEMGCAKNGEGGPLSFPPSLISWDDLRRFSHPPLTHSLPPKMRADLLT